MNKAYICVYYHRSGAETSFQFSRKHAYLWLANMALGNLEELGGDHEAISNMIRAYGQGNYERVVSIFVSHNLSEENLEVSEVSLEDYGNEPKVMDEDELNSLLGFYMKNDTST